MIKRFFAALAALGPSLFSPCRRSVNQEQETGELDGLAAELGLGDDAVVIGGQYFKALQAEERWAETRPPGESPLPEAEYDAYRDELNLLNPAPSSLDALIREVCRRYAKSDDVERGRMRDSITMSQFYTLMAFAERSAVLGLREADERHVTDGLTALAMIDSERVDYRDILMALGLVYHVATRVSANAEALLQHAGGLAKPAVAEIFAQWSALTPEDRSLRDSWGHEEVETTHGRGFVGWGFERYEPTIDLLAVAIELSDLFAADDYQPSIEIASELPDVWLAPGRKSQRKRALAEIRGAATVSGSLRPDRHAQHDCQQFTVFLVEAATDSDAQTLLRLAEENKSAEHCQLAHAAGRLFGLIVARSFEVGVEAYETQQSLSRFGEGVSTILARHAA